MSRTIDHDHPYTESEKEYLLTLATGEDLIRVNDRKFAHLDSKARAELQGRFAEDSEKERKIDEAIQKQIEQEEADSYHPDDIAVVEPLTIAKLREALEKEGLRNNVTKDDLIDPSDEENPFTEKEALAYRLLEHLDKKRKAQQPQGKH